MVKTTEELTAGGSVSVRPCLRSGQAVAQSALSYTRDMPENRAEVFDVWFSSPDPEHDHWEKDVTITTVDGLIQPLESNGTHWKFSHKYRETTPDGDHDSLVFVPRLARS